MTLRSKLDKRDRFEELKCKAETAICLRELGKHQEALNVLDECLAEIESIKGNKDNLTTAYLMLAKGMTFKRIGRLLEAEKLYVDCLHVRESLLDKNHPDVLAICHNLSMLY